VASQKTPYLFLYARAYEDVKLVLAGWEATLLWPHVLCLLKQRGGVFDDDESSPEFVAATLRCPVEIASAGMAGLKRAGLLVDGSRRCPGGAGGSHERTGWVTPSWDKWAVDRRERGEGRAKTTVTRPLPDRSRALPTVTPDNGELELERELEENNPPTPRKRGGADVLKAWTALRQIRPRLSEDPPPKNDAGGKALRKAITSIGADALTNVFRWAHESDHDRARFLRGERDGKRKQPSWVTCCRNATEYAEFAAEWADGGGHSDSPDDYERPADGDNVEFRGTYVFRLADGVWYPDAKQLLNKRLPWRTALDAVALRRIQGDRLDLYPPEEYAAALAASRFPASVSNPHHLQAAIDDAINDIRQDMGLI